MTCTHWVKLTSKIKRDTIENMIFVMRARFKVNRTFFLCGNNKNGNSVFVKSIYYSFKFATSFDSDVSLFVLEN